MTKLIPWALPTIPGDSEGGYTPQPTPGPVRVDPYNFEAAGVRGSWSSVFQDDTVAVNPSNQISFSGTNQIFGIVPVDVVNVKSMVGQIWIDDSNYFQVNINLQTLGTTGTVTRTGKGSFSVGRHSVVRYVWFVYNAAGEIIQQYERVVS